MNEIKVMTPKGKAKQVAKIALEVGIREVSVSQVYVHGPNEEKEQLSMEVNVSLARQFLDQLLLAPFFDPNHYSFSSDELMSIVSQDPPEKVSWPLTLSPPTVLQDLWLQNHITIAYIFRAFVSALLLSYALLEADLVTLLAALLFTPFLTQVLAMGFGLLMRDWGLSRQGLLALSTSTALTVIAGVVVASMIGGPMKYDQFGTLVSNFAISFIVGIVAGLDTADKSGRREFIAVAAAAQFASFPAWFGISLVIGFPDSETTMWRIITFFVNILTILLVSIGVYAALHYRPEVLQKYLAITRGKADDRT
jgi:hypothetical protein